MRTVWIAAMLATAMPALAQVDGAATQPRMRVITVFGLEECPKSNDPDEIVVCKREAEDSARLPPIIREEQKIAKRDNVPAGRTALVDRGAAGGPCSAVGAQGQTGCSGGINLLGLGAKVVQAVTGNETVPDKAPQ